MIKKKSICLGITLILPLMFSFPSYAQQIITDGKTNTTLTVNGNVTDVKTTTMYSTTAINSFKRFNVDAGNTVNLIHPTNSVQLVNLVNDEKTNINGILNSIKAGHIGGKVYFINPYGVTVGPSGVINVSSLTITTPIKSESDKIFDSSNKLVPAVLVKAVNNTLPTNTSAEVVNQGKINAIGDVKINSGNVQNHGKIQTNAAFQENNITIGDVVNVNDIDTGAPPQIFKGNGTIYIGATGNILNTGEMNTDGTTSVPAKTITLTGSTITLASGSKISANGKGAASSGALVTISATDITANNTNIDTNAGITGNSGSTNITANNSLNIINGMNYKGGVTKGTAGTLTLKAANLYGTGNITTGGANIAINTSTETAFYNNTNIQTQNTDINGLSVFESGDINIKTPSLNLTNGTTTFDTSANNNLKSGPINILADTIYIKPELEQTFNSGDNDIAFNRITKGDINLGDKTAIPGSYKADPGVFADETIFHITANKITFGTKLTSDISTTQNININKELNYNNNLSLGAAKAIFVNNNVTAKNIEFTALTDISGPGIISSPEKLSLNAVTGKIGTNSLSPLKIDSGNNGYLNAYSKTKTYLQELTGDMRVNEIKSAGDVYLLADNDIINVRSTTGYSITANNLYIKNFISTGNYYMFGIDDDPFNNNVQTSVFDSYKATFQSKGENWSKMPEENFKLFDSDKGTLSKTTILSSLKEYADKTTSKDTLFILYEGHGGQGMADTNGDENNGKTVTPSTDEYMALSGFTISDDEFANALSGAKGTVVFVTSQCYGGGMFKGNNDIDQVSTRNGFKFYGMSGALENYYGWASGYSQIGGTTTGFIHQNLLNSVNNVNSSFVNYNRAIGGTSWYNETYRNAYAVNANGNVYLNEWHNAINQRSTFYVNQNGTIFPYSYVEATNMTADDFVENPIIIKNWSPQTSGALTHNLGSDTKPLSVYVKGTLDAEVTGNVNLSGYINISKVKTETGNISIDAALAGKTNISTQGNIDLKTSTYNLNIDQIQGNNVTITQKTASKYILNARTDSQANIIANNITVNNPSGYIGQATKAINYDINGGIVNFINHPKTILYVNEVNP